MKTFLGNVESIDGMGDGLRMGSGNWIPSVFELNEPCCPLFPKARCSKLSTTVTLMNICIIQYVYIDKFMDELMSLLHKFNFSTKNVCHLNNIMQKPLQERWAWNTSS